MKNKIITIFFILLLACASVIPFFVPDNYYSENEKRKLTQKDDVRLSEYFDGRFQTNLEEYLSGQFPERDTWISIKTISDLAVGKRDAGGVYFGRDGYLFQKFSGYNTKRIKANTNALLKLQAISEKQGVHFSVMPIPTSIEILSDKLPAFAPHADQSAVTEYMEKQGLNVINPEAILKKHSSEYIYYRNDHHYTSLGAYYCYCAYRDAIGRTAPKLSEYQTEILSENFLGTSYSKVNYPFAKPDAITAYYKSKNHIVSYNNDEYITDSLYERKYLDAKDMYAVFLNSNQPQTKISGSGNGGKLLLIKDSYGNTFAQFPVDDYEEVHMLDLRFFRGNVEEYIKENGITEVLAIYGIPNFANDVTIKA